ncbi:MAG TPA: hypothetical protein VGN34_07110, partial [Ktedonobacteraceae bacterium]
YTGNSSTGNSISPHVERLGADGLYDSALLSSPDVLQDVCMVYPLVSIPAPGLARAGQALIRLRGA